MAGEHAARIDGGHDRRADALRKIADLLFCGHRAAAGQDDRARGIGAQNGGALQRFGVGARTCRDGRLEAPGLDRLCHHVRGDLDMHRAGTAGQENGEGTLDDERQVCGIEQGVGIEGKRLHHALLVRQFMQQPAAMAERIPLVDARDDQHGHGILPRLRHRRNGIGEARAGDDEGDARLAGDARIAVRHEARALFVARRDVADLRGGEAAIELHRMNAGNAEHDLHTIGFEQIDQNFADGFGGHA